MVLIDHTRTRALVPKDEYPWQRDIIHIARANQKPPIDSTDQSQGDFDLALHRVSKKLERAPLGIFTVYRGKAVDRPSQR